MKKTASAPDNTPGKLSSDIGNKTVTTYIGLGSNVGDRNAHLRMALRRLANLGQVGVVSSVYETSAVGPVRQADFLNAVAELRTQLPPEQLLNELLRIEREHGRDRNTSTPKGPRTLDLDLLIYDDLILQSDVLTVPHPALAERRFVLVPLAEIAPQWRHPATGKNPAQMLEDLERSDADSQSVRKIYASSN